MNEGDNKISILGDGLSFPSLLKHRLQEEINNHILTQCSLQKA